MAGGRLRALPQRLHPEYGQFQLSPRMTRALIRERKWERALAFQTRNPLHRAHEYALVAGAERLTGEGAGELGDGVSAQPAPAILPTSKQALRSAWAVKRYGGLVQSLVNSKEARE